MGTPHFPKLQHYWNLSISVISRALVRRSLTPMQGCSRYILQPQPTRPHDSRCGESYTSAGMQPVYSAAPADSTTWLSLWRFLHLCRDAAGVFCSPSRFVHMTLVMESLTPLQGCSRCILQPQAIWPHDTRCGESYISAGMQPVYSIASAKQGKKKKSILYQPDYK